MSHRERCMAGVFSKILGLLGIIKDKSTSAKAFPQELPFPGTTCQSPRVLQGCGAATPMLNQKMHECPPHVSAFNVVFNKDVPPAAKGSEAIKVIPTGFQVRVSVPVSPKPSPPVVVECTPGSGGVQGLQWYSEKLMMDEDGDIAQEFLDEVISHSSGSHSGYTRMLPSFKIKRPAKLRGPVCTYDGNVLPPLLT